MKILNLSVLILSLSILSSCSHTQSLQEYFVDNSENPNFISIDLPVSLLNIDKADLDDKQKDALKSLKKLNVLAFKKTDANTTDYQKEKLNIGTILKDNKFIELMKMNTVYGNATVRYLGVDDAIEEVIIYGDNDDKGFMVVRVLGSDMDPAKMISFLQALKKSDYNGEGLEKIGNFFKG